MPTTTFPAGTQVTCHVPGAICANFAANRCRFGDKCYFKHGLDDARDHEALFAKHMTNAVTRHKTAAKGSTSKPKAKVMFAAKQHEVSTTSGELWTLDTGSAVDATGFRPDSGALPFSDPREIATAKGDATVKKVELTQFDELGQTVEAVILPDADPTTRLLSVGRRCAEMGFWILLATL